MVKGNTKEEKTSFKGVARAAQGLRVCALLSLIQSFTFHIANWMVIYSERKVKRSMKARKRALRASG
jgi:hypothetical protein